MATGRAQAGDGIQDVGDQLKNATNLNGLKTFCTIWSSCAGYRTDRVEEAIAHIDARRNAPARACAGANHLRRVLPLQTRRSPPGVPSDFLNNSENTDKK